MSLRHAPTVSCFDVILGLWLPHEGDQTQPANAHILSDETLYFNNMPGVWRMITASSPDSYEIYISLSEANSTLLFGNNFIRPEWRASVAGFDSSSDLIFQALVEALF